MTNDEYPTLLDLLEQDEVWGRLDTRVKIIDMDPEHLDNVVNWLIRNAERLKFAYEVECLNYSGPSADTVACDMVSQGFDSMMAQPAEQWLEEFPLMRKLRDLQEARQTDGWL